MISLSSRVTDNIHNIECCEVGDKNNHISSLDDACTTHQTNTFNPVMPKTFSRQRFISLSILKTHAVESYQMTVMVRISFHVGP